MITINCIGCGRVGKSILKLIVNNQLGEIKGIVNQSIESAEQATQFIGQGTALKHVEDLLPSKIYFIAAHDGAIEKICRELSRKNLLPSEAIIVHFSGSLSSDALLSARDSKCLIASVHPIKSFAHPEAVVNNFLDTYCAIEGDEQATLILKRLFENMGGIVFNIKKKYKAHYHAAMVMANNYLTTLHYHTVKNLEKTGIEINISKKLVSMLMSDSLKNINTLNYEAALTGPIQRGDTGTVARHIEALQHDLITKAIYLALGKGTLSLIDHASPIMEEFQRILEDKR
ncbi:MAG: uncharacterized protein K0S27_1744 [Gammaproteobacteria bacterium]|nr:uncharacterized protein [Gammaproteobacteria bacterium]